MSLRILHISTRLILGGSQENTVLSCEGQAELGHDVHLAFGPIYGPEGSLLERVEHFRTSRGDRIHTHIVPSMIRAIHPLKDIRAYRELLRLVRTLRPDIVHTHSSKAGILGRAAAWQAFRTSTDHRPAVVHTIHGPPFHASQSPVVNAIYTAAERYAAKRCHAVVSVADAMTRDYLSRGIGTPGLYTTVYSGMETDRFLTPPPGESRETTRAALGIEPGDFVIGTVARLAELKGHDDVLDALADELRARPSWKLLWVGDGWLRDRLMARVASLGLSRQVVTTGLVPPEDVPRFIRAMDLLVHPSYREGLPRTVPQALLCGVVPVAYDTDGTGEICINGRTGRLIPTGDRAGLRAAVCALYDHADERIALADAGRSLCRDRFSTQRMVADLERVYAAALVRAGGAAADGIARQ